MARYQGNSGAPFAVREGLTSKRRENLRWYVEEFLDFPEGGYVTRAKRIEREMDEYGRALWKGLQGPEVQNWLGAVQARRGGRLELRAETKKDEVAFRTPWELLRAGDRLLHQHRVTVVRRPVSKTPNLHAADTSEGLRVLVIVCRPEDERFLDPRYTPQAILDALAARSEVQVDFCRPGTLKALRAQLQAADHRGEPYHVVHFDGHGGTGVLCFEKEDGRTDLVKARRFGDLMSEFEIPLVVLEACRTSTLSFAHETVASELLRQGVGTVVAMGHAVHMDLTEVLMRGFYGALTEAVPVGEALRRARNEAYTKPERRRSANPEAPIVELLDWFVPQLYQGGEDPVLLPATPQVSHAHTTEPRLVNFPPPPRAGFEGRGRELHRLERALLRHPVAVLAAPGGTGKTALVREAAHWWTRTGWFEAAIFVSFEGKPSPEKVVNEVGLALEGTDFYKQSEPAEWVAEQLAQRRLLLVWDNFESVLPAFQNGQAMPPELAELAERWTAGGSRILVTSRAPEVPLPGAQPVDLWTLSDPEALGLLARLLDKLGKGRTEREELGWDAETLQPLIDATGGHPLALELVTPYLEQLGPEGVVEVAWFVAESLKTFLERTGRGAEGGRLIREVYERGGGDVEGELSEAQAALAREATWAFARQDPTGALAALNKLFTRLETVQGWDSREERARTLTTLGRTHYRLLGQPAAALEPLKKAEYLFRELELEGDDSSNRATLLCDQAHALKELGRFQEAKSCAEEALEISRKAGDIASVGRILGLIGDILLVTGRLAEAETQYTEALEAASASGDNATLGITYQHLGVVARQRGRYDEAEEHYRRALEGAEKAGDALARVRILNLLGVVEEKLGNLSEAQTWFERSRALAEELEDLSAQAQARSNLAIVYSQRAEQTEEPDEARRWLHRAIGEEREALRIAEALGLPPWRGISLGNLAEYLRRAGQLEEANQIAREAVATRERLNDPELWKPLSVLEHIAHARADQTAAAEWRRRKEEAFAEAQERAGVGGLGLQGVTLLLQLAHAARADGVPLGAALAQANAPDDLLDQIRERDPWLLTHLQALAGNEGQPEAKVPALYAEVVDAAWKAVG